MAQPETTQLDTFDPADWLNWAERIGYKIYLWDAFGDGCLGLIVLNPPAGRKENDIDLWWALRPNDAQADINEKVLALHLWDIGRAGPENMRPDYAAYYTRGDVYKCREAVRQ